MDENVNLKLEPIDCGRRRFCLSDEVKLRYILTGSNQDTYDVLPLYGLQDYQVRLMKSLSILENPAYAAKWQQFKDGLPFTARNAKMITFMGVTGSACFKNYRRQRLPSDYVNKEISPPSAEAIFHNKSKIRREGNSFRSHKSTTPKIC